MSEGRRPGGLTALAVINFIFGGFAVILFGLVLLGGAFLSAADSSDPDVQKAKELAGFIWLFAAYYGTIAFLLIASGVGYLQMKRVLGRVLGNVYALLAIAYVAVILAVGQPFGIGTIIGLIYPVLTLALLNTTFREDFVN